MFIRQQLSPYNLLVDRLIRIGDWTHWADQQVPAFQYQGPCPHGRNATTGEASDWGPDGYGYTDFDDYHLAIYGA